MGIESKELEEQHLINKILQVKSDTAIKALMSYGATILEIYQYTFGLKNICELSYEMQCAIFDVAPDIYSLYVDDYFITSMAPYRVDKQLIFLYASGGMTLDEVNSSMRG